MQGEDFTPGKDDLLEVCNVQEEFALSSGSGDGGATVPTAKADADAPPDGVAHAPGSAVDEGEISQAAWEEAVAELDSEHEPVSCEPGHASNAGGKHCWTFEEFIECTDAPGPDQNPTSLAMTHPPITSAATSTSATVVPNATPTGGAAPTAARTTAARKAAPTEAAAARKATPTSTARKAPTTSATPKARVLSLDELKVQHKCEPMQPRHGNVSPIIFVAALVEREKGQGEVEFDKDVKESLLGQDAQARLVFHDDKTAVPMIKGRQEGEWKATIDENGRIDFNNKIKVMELTSQHNERAFCLEVCVPHFPPIHTVKFETRTKTKTKQAKAVAANAAASAPPACPRPQTIAPPHPNHPLACAASVSPRSAAMGPGARGQPFAFPPPPATPTGETTVLTTRGAPTRGAPTLSAPTLAPTTPHSSSAATPKGGARPGDTVAGVQGTGHMARESPCPEDMIARQIFLTPPSVASANERAPPSLSTSSSTASCLSSSSSSSSAPFSPPNSPSTLAPATKEDCLRQLVEPDQSFEQLRSLLQV